jgi:hypothetical protein
MLMAQSWATQKTRPAMTRHQARLACRDLTRKSDPTPGGESVETARMEGERRGHTAQQSATETAH